MAAYTILGTRKREQLVLGLLTVVILALDMWAVLCDGRPSGSDTFLNQALELLTQERSWGEWLRALYLQCPKGPLAPLLALPLLLLTGKTLAGARLLSVICHLVMTVQGGSLARTLHPRAGLWAALIIGFHPFIAGWCRLDFHEPLLVCAFLGAVQLVLSPSRSPGRGALLGMLLALGLLTKLSFLVFAVVPGVWLIFQPAREGRRGWTFLLAAVGTGLILTLPWVVLNWDQILANYAMSSEENRAMALWRRLIHLSRMPGLLPLLIIGIAGGAVQLAQSRSMGAWLSAALLLPFLLLLVWFHYWSRYLLPLSAFAAVLAAPLLTALLERIAGINARRAAAVLVVIILLVPGPWITLNGFTLAIPREQASGMLSPDRGSYRGYAAITAWLTGRGIQRWGMLTDSELALARLEGRELALRRQLCIRRGGCGHRSKIMGWPEADRRHRKGETLYFMVVLGTLTEGEHPTAARIRRAWAQAPREEGMAANRRGFRYLMTHPHKSVLFRQRDADGLLYLVVKLPGRQ